MLNESLLFFAAAPRLVLHACFRIVSKVLAYLSFHYDVTFSSYSRLIDSNYGNQYKGGILKK